MKALISKLFIIETIFTYILMNLNSNEGTFYLQPADEGIGSTSTCSFSGVTEDFEDNEVFLFCYEYEVPFDYDFFLSMGEGKNYKFILKSFFASRIILERNKQIKSTTFVDDKCELKKTGIEFNKKFKTYIYNISNLSLNEFKQKIKNCNIEFINLGNLIEGEETLYLTPITPFSEHMLTSYTIYTPNKNTKLEKNSKDLISLCITIYSRYSRLKNECISELRIKPYKRDIIANPGINVSYEHIKELELKEKLLEKSKMQKIEEGEELNFRFPSEEEKGKIIKELKGLFDCSVLSWSIKTEEMMKNKKMEKEEDISVTKKRE